MFYKTHYSTCVVKYLVLGGILFSNKGVWDQYFKIEICQGNVEKVEISKSIDNFGWLLIKYHFYGFLHTLLKTTFYYDFKLLLLKKR